MKYNVNTFLAFAALCVLQLAVSFENSAQAQATRTWVSGVGDDANPCSRTAPCRTFAGAISKTAANGEISSLDPAGFGAVTITKSMTINGEGTLSGITASSINAMTINAGTSDTVVIKNILIHFVKSVPPNIDFDGIKILQAKSVILENVTIFGGSAKGVHIVASSDVEVSLRNVSIIGAEDSAVFVQNSSGRANVTIDNSNFRTNLNGVQVNNGFVSIANSVLSQNSGFGVLTSGTGTATLENVILSQNSTAVQAGTGSTIRLSNTAAYDNLLGYGCGGGTLVTAGDNRKAGNTGLGGSACAPTANIAMQ